MSLSLYVGSLNLGCGGLCHKLAVSQGSPQSCGQEPWPRVKLDGCLGYAGTQLLTCCWLGAVLSSMACPFPALMGLLGEQKIVVAFICCLWKVDVASRWI